MMWPRTGISISPCRSATYSSSLWFPLPPLTGFDLVALDNLGFRFSLAHCLPKNLSINVPVSASSLGADYVISGCPKTDVFGHLSSDAIFLFRRGTPRQYYSVLRRDYSNRNKWKDFVEERYNSATAKGGPHY